MSEITYVLTAIIIITLSFSIFQGTMLTYLNMNLYEKYMSAVAYLIKYEVEYISSSNIESSIILYIFVPPPCILVICNNTIYVYKNRSLLLRLPLNANVNSTLSLTLLNRVVIKKTLEGVHISG